MSDERRYPADFDVQGEAQRMMLALEFLSRVNIEAIIAVVEDAHNVAWFIDPTAYRDALYRGDMDTLAEVARSLREPTRLFREKVLPKMPGVPA